MRLVLGLLTSLACVPAASAAPLTPNAGALTVTGTVRSTNGEAGEFAIAAVLKDGDFSGTGKLTARGRTVEGPLLSRRSYLQNGRCVFNFESGRSRVELSGPCDTTAYGAQGGRVDAFLQDAGGFTGEMSGRITLSRAGAAASARPGVVPTSKLTCAYQDRKISFRAGEATQYSLSFSNMGSLTLAPGGTYAAGAGAKGRYTRAGDKIRLVSGPWAGATGTLSPDRSGRPSVVFELEENRRPDGVHIVDPYTTRCTESR